MRDGEQTKAEATRVEETQETEDDVIGLAASFLLVQLLHFMIGGAFFWWWEVLVKRMDVLFGFIVSFLITLASEQLCAADEQHRTADGISRLLDNANASFPGVNVEGHVPEWNWQ